MPESEHLIPWTPSGPMLDDMWAGDGESDPSADDVPDMLATVFAQQRILMDRVWAREIKNFSVPTHPSQFGDLDERNVQGRIHETFGYLVRELSEAMQHLKNKPWKERLTSVDVEAFREEMADSFHFFVEMCILAGIDAESLFLSYFAKAATNIDRTTNGY